MKGDASILQKQLVSSPILTEKDPAEFLVNEIFYSVQGEGKLAGTPMVFIRFSQCNLRCTLSNAGFDCDTEFMSHRKVSLGALLEEVHALNSQGGWVLLTGGEPGLQVTPALLNALHERQFKVAIETNGTIKLPDGIDWICVSPKSAEHTLRQRTADEVKYVRASGMTLPIPSISATHYLISPAFQPDGSVAPKDLTWCVELVKQNPRQWALTIQYHKILGVR
jgi:7-carboxy-7-deazaguanine synthase